jgi:hypothetical protein
MNPKLDLVWNRVDDSKVDPIADLEFNDGAKMTTALNNIKMDELVWKIRESRIIAETPAAAAGKK